MADDADLALEHMTALVRALADIMKTGQFPAVDYQDERAVLTEAGTGALGAIGYGEASGEGRAKRAAQLAVLDLVGQIGPVARSHFLRTP